MKKTGDIVSFNFALTGSIETGTIEKIDLRAKEYLVNGVEGGKFIYGWVAFIDVLEVRS